MPEGWLAEATTARLTIDHTGQGYGYQWWTYADGSYAARGIFGQGIFIDPKRKLVIASNANWAGGAEDPVAGDARETFYQTVRQALDDEARQAGTGSITDFPWRTNAATSAARSAGSSSAPPG